MQEAMPWYHEVHAIPSQTIEVENNKHLHHGHQFWHLAARFENLN